ncbi:hypothetical protein NKH36_10885 [Mesorhizobium sp. M1312]|uniref:hypothetical protein n=1 Tax=unclassified Mesorhizobium TaxID=325217 RepID=UPI0033360C8A
MGRRLIQVLAAIALMACALPAMAQEQPKTGGTLKVRINADIRATDGLSRDANTDRCCTISLRRWWLIAPISR